MATLYDIVLNRKFGPRGGKFLFLAGLRLRALFFASRNLLGVMTYRKKKRPLDLSRIQKILIIRTDRIGDIILSTPALRALRLKYPNAQIDYVVQAKYAPLLNCYEGWSNVFGTDIEDSRRMKALGAELHRGGYDVAVVQHPAKYAYELLKTVDAPCSIGWRAKGYGYVLTRGFPDDRARALRHQVENNLMLFAPLDVFDPSPAFPVRESPAGMAQYRAFCARHGLLDTNERILALHPGSYSPRVRWMPERFGELAARAQGKGFKVVIFGTRAERDLVEEVARRAVGPSITAIDEFDLEGLVSFLKHATVFVGNSTGPMHIAASTGTRTIALFGNRYPMDCPELWRPWGANGTAVASRVCQCTKCLPWACGNMACLAAITVDDVWKEIQRPPAGLLPAQGP